MKTNNLKYKAVKSNITYSGKKCDIIVNIILNDECKNGHQDFAITADIYKAGKRNDDAMLAFGCMHEEIVKHFTEFKIFVDLHLSDCTGVPMYAVENGYYHLKNGFNKEKPEGNDFKNAFCDYYRITGNQFDIIKTSQNKFQYALFLQNLGILEQWNKQAQIAIKLLEKLTGDTFVNDSVKTQFKIETSIILPEGGNN